MLECHLEPRLQLRLLEERHVRFLNETDATCLAHLDLGYSNAEIAAALSVTEATVRRHVTSLAHRVFDLTELPATRTVTVYNLGVSVQGNYDGTRIAWVDNNYYVKPTACPPLHYHYTYSGF